MADVYCSIVVTGAGGMLGSALAAELRKRGSEPHAYLRAELDISDEKALRQVFERHQPTLFLNCAAHTKVDLCETETERADAINGYAVGTIARLCREHGTMLVHYSTDFVFDGRSDRPYRADDPTNPISAYGRSKRLGEIQLQENAPPQWMILRTAWVYGRGGSNFPRVIVERARGGHPLKVVNDETGSPTLTNDLAATTLALIDRGGQGLIHATNSGAVNRYDYTKAILKTFGIEADLSPITTEQWLKIRPNQARRPAYSVLDDASLVKFLGHPMRPWQEALVDFKGDVEAGGF